LSFYRKLHASAMAATRRVKTLWHGKNYCKAGNFFRCSVHGQPMWRVAAFE
jgi:hypothetical protein